MKEFVKAEDLLQLIVDLEAEVDSASDSKSELPEVLAYYDGWSMCAINAVTNLSKLLDIPVSTELDINVELEDEDD